MSSDTEMIFGKETFEINKRGMRRETLGGEY
jgi:hypothetical protein